MGHGGGSPQDRRKRELESGELRRLREGPGPDERAPTGTLFAVHVVSEAGDASGVAARVRAALTAVVSGSDERIDPREWDGRLPAWLLERFASERGEPGGEGWTLLAWVHWFEPDGLREWFWWDVNEIDAHQLRLFFVFIDAPYATLGLRFLLQAAGADHISDWVGLRS